MKSFLPTLCALMLLVGCSTNGHYDAAEYLEKPERDSVLTSIITYIFIAPPYTLMQDRFKPEHRSFYSLANSRFSLEKYFVAPDETHFFYVVRQGPKANEKRGVGGHFKRGNHFELTSFREIFVTPVMAESELKTKGAFLFEEMVKGNIEKYLGMESYVQWPNKISSYDTTTYEWKMISEKSN